jgi:hypothetical protein
MTHGSESSKHNCRSQAINCRTNKQIVVEGNCTSNTGPSAPKSEQENLSKEEYPASGTVEENKENVCSGNLDLLVQEAVKDLLNIVHIVSINCTLL